MKLMKNIIARVLAFWALLVFASTLLVILIPVWLISLQPEPKRTQLIYRIFQIWMKVFFVLIGVRRNYKGYENFRKGENYVVICNHNSFMDVPLSSPGIPGPNKTIAKAEMARIPLFGTVYKSGSVLVDRKNEQSRKLSYSKMKAVMDMGLHMCIYPEGTRNKTKEPLQRFHDGAFRLAIETGKFIIPAVIFNTNRVLPRSKGFYFWPHKVEMHFLPPISPDGMTIESLKQKSFETIGNYYTQTGAGGKGEVLQ
jgi:1-acyl-sn-glycerol-3-phosphate acyltransferase